VDCTKQVCDFDGDVKKLIDKFEIAGNLAVTPPARPTARPKPSPTKASPTSRAPGRNRLDCRVQTCWSMVPLHAGVRGSGKSCRPLRPFPSKRSASRKTSIAARCRLASRHHLLKIGALSEIGRLHFGLAVLASHYLRQMPEMAVGRAKEEVVLDSEGGDPEVVGWKAGAFGAKLEEELGIVMRGLLVG
jgi:hypothetical protein